jgi:hypothetical protein
MVSKSTIRWLEDAEGEKGKDGGWREGWSNGWSGAGFNRRRRDDGLGGLEQLQRAAADAGLPTTAVKKGGEETAGDALLLRHLLLLLYLLLLLLLLLLLVTDAAMHQSRR